jgi:hypothetical protein
MEDQYHLTANIFDGHVMDLADVLSVLRKAGRVKYSLGDGESHTMERLRYGRVKLGVARYEYYVSSQKCMVNK